MSLLESSLEAAYDARAKEKMKPKGLSSVAATTLRGVAAAGYGLGTAMYYYFPGAGLAFTAPAAAASLAADAIDSRYYHKSGLVKGLGFSDAKIAAESIAAKASGMFPVRYFPIGGLIDLYRGRRKFQGAAIKGLTHDDEVMSYAISKFADKLYESQGKRKVIPLDSLRDHRYSAAGEKQYSVAA